MHTLKIIAGGLLLLGIFLLAGRLVIATQPRVIARYFIPVWLVCAVINLWMGVSGAGYSVRDELPVLLIVFLVPAAVALLIAWKA